MRGEGGSLRPAGALVRAMSQRSANRHSRGRNMGVRFLGAFEGLISHGISLGSSTFRRPQCAFFLRATLGCCCALAFSGCMVLPLPSVVELHTTVVPLHRNASSVAVVVVSHVEANEPGPDTIKFSQAIADSIEASGVFATVLSKTSADYLLDVNFSPPYVPALALTSSVTLDSDWTLTNLKTNAEVWHKAIESIGIAHAGEQAYGPDRAHLACVRAGRQTIADGLTAIGKLDLGSAIAPR